MKNISIFFLWWIYCWIWSKVGTQIFSKCFCFVNAGALSPSRKFHNYETCFEYILNFKFYSSLIWKQMNYDFTCLVIHFKLFPIFFSSPQVLFIPHLSLLSLKSIHRFIMFHTVFQNDSFTTCTVPRVCYLMM